MEDIAAHQLAASKSSSSSFEFSRKKRWADTIVAQLIDVAVLVFGHQGNILHCDAAVGSVLGYQEDELLTHNFANFLHDGDVALFFEQLNQSVAARTDLVSYVRVKPNAARAGPNARCRLYEVRAQPYYSADGKDCVCLFGTISPYPSFNTKRIDSLLPLKVDNHLLDNRLAGLRSSSTGDDTADESMTSSDDQDASPYRRHHHHHAGTTGSTARTPQSLHFEPVIAHPVHSFHHSHVDPSYASKYATTQHVGKQAPSPPPKVNLRGAAAQNDHDDVTETNSLKRKRRSDASDGRVCTACGRNNSPEWRKGPQGPKTLCNACGLRWAKKAKRSHEPVPVVPASSPMAIEA